MKIVPQGKQILGKVAQVIRAGALQLTPTQLKGVTHPALIEAVGSEVARYKPGELVIPYRINNIFFQDGFHRILFLEDEVLAVVEDMSPDALKFLGEGRDSLDDAVRRFEGGRAS